MMSDGPHRAPSDDGGDASAWNRFFGMLDPEPRRAASAYAALRQRLVDVLRWRGVPGAEDLADEVFDRVVARVAEGEVIRNVTAFAIGVAHRIALEATRRAAKFDDLDEASAGLVPAPNDRSASSERATDAARLELCLDELPAGARDQILRYYGGAGRQRIAERKRLAQELGIGLNALRIRMHRLRGRLLGCLGGPGGHAHGAPGGGA